MTTPALAFKIDAEVARRFDEAVGRFKPTVSESDYRLQSLCKALGTVDGLRVLDLGCGKGRFGHKLEEAGAKVFGLDVSRGMLAQANPLAVIQGSATRLPWPDRLFDVVIAVEVFQHVALMNQALSEAWRVLVPQGRLFIIDKNALALNVHRPWLLNLLVKVIDERRGRGLYRPSDPVQERWFPPAQLAMHLRRAGFEAIKTEGLLSPEESRSSVFRTWEWTRAMWLWSARKRGGVSSEPT